MCFRLSTMLCVVTFVCILLGWYVDHYHRYRNNIVGVWYYPTPDINMNGYWETLTIRRDGTFTKFQQYRMGSDTYNGTYAIAEDGLVTFHVTSKLYDNARIPPQIEKFDVNAIFRCRLAVDSHANLIIVDLHPIASQVVMPEDVNLSWHCYSAMSHDAQGEAMMKRLMGQH